MAFILLRMVLKELTLLCICSGTSVMPTDEVKTSFAANGSKNMLNSAYLLKGTVKRFPLLLS